MNLSHNLIARVDHSFGKDLSLARLRHLDLSYNKIEAIDDGFFVNFQSLRTLDLKYNRLQSLSTGFQKLSQLSHLSVFGNFINCLPVFLFDMDIHRFEFEWDIMVEPLMMVSANKAGQQEEVYLRKRVEDSLVDLHRLKVFVKNTVHSSTEFVRFQHFLSFMRKQRSTQTCRSTTSASASSTRPADSRSSWTWRASCTTCWSTLRTCACGPAKSSWPVSSKPAAS